MTATGTKLARSRQVRFALRLLTFFVMTAVLGALASVIVAFALVVFAFILTNLMPLLSVIALSAAGYLAFRYRDQLLPLITSKN